VVPRRRFAAALIGQCVAPAFRATVRAVGASDPNAKAGYTAEQRDADFLRVVLEAVPAFIVRLDPEQRVRYINRLQPGFTMEHVIGRSAYDFIEPAYHEQHRHAHAEALRTGRPSHFLAKGVAPDGTASYYQSYAVPIDNGDGRRATCIIALDVTEHVARAEALHESEGKLRIAVEATGLGLWTWDIANHAVELDQRAVDIIGAKPATPTEYITAFVHPEDRAQVEQEIARAEQGDPRFQVHRIVRRDKTERWVLPCGQVVKDEAGHVTRIFGGLLDVTSQRLTEERLRQAQKLDAVGSLTAGVAHNFNNMLAVILPALDLALRQVDSAQREVLQDAMHAARRSAELITQLMTFAGQRRPGAPRVQDVVPALEGAVSMCRRTFERQVQIEVAIDPPSALVACDAPAIEQVILNLLINARDAVLAANRAEPRIRVELTEVTLAGHDGADRSPKRHVRICVQDNGIGMSAAVRRRAFEPFFTTKEPGKGNGLGLATSYGIVRDQGGTIALESIEGSGTIAEVLLPAATQPSADPAFEAPRVVKNRRGTILVVDDEPAVRRVIELLLLERGHQVALAGDGASAVAQIDAGLRPDLILLDRSMPGWPVKLTLSEIRKRAADTPLLFFTGEEVTAEQRDLVQDVLYKPLSMDELVRAIERWVEQAR
jgi:two-component system cell cycle sensor histidine kinase/response regulator CckA